ncbi:MAG: hypothetical protein ACK6A7_07255 [Planctomycetota bacterium]|jgi:hypothetical protein
MATSVPKRGESMKQLTVGMIVRMLTDQYDDPCVESLVLYWLDCFDQTNSQLAINSPILHGRRVDPQRKNPIELDTPVFGEHLVIVYDNHDPSLFIVNFDGISELENFVCGQFFQRCIDILVPIIGGEPRRFSISFRDQFGKDTVSFFESREQEVLEGTHQNIRLNWI